MKPLRECRIEAVRRSPVGGRVRRVGASLVLALFVAIPCVAAHDARADVRPSLGTELPASHGARIPDVSRNAGGVPLFVSSRPVRQGHHGLDALTLLGFVALFASVGRRPDLDRGERFRFDALYVSRRGPPYLHHTI